MDQLIYSTAYALYTLQYVQYLSCISHQNKFTWLSLNGLYRLFRTWYYTGGEGGVGWAWQVSQPINFASHLSLICSQLQTE